VPINQKQLKQLLRYENGKLYWLNTGIEAGCVDKKLKRHRIKINNKSYFRSRLVFLYFKGYLPKYPRFVIDHKNKNKLDDKIENLRKATNGQNKANGQKYKDTNSLPKGVYSRPSGKYQAHIRFNGVLIYLGTFDNPEKAHEAYCQKGIELHGEFFYAG
jgi:hypothetical protein